jgi:hypothetical protein
MATAKIYSNLAMQTSDHFVEPASYETTKLHANSSVVAYRFYEHATLAAPNTLRLYSNGMIHSSWLIELSGGGGGEGSGYTATHYVVPFGGVSGANNDYEILSQAAYNAATNSNTPTTLGNAQRWATAGNKVRCAPGIYVHGAMTENAHDPGFHPTNSGTLGNEIVFFAAYPAARYWNSPELWSQLRWSSPPTIYGPGNPIMGSTDLFGGNHVIFDGFYAHGTYVPAYPSQGAFGGGAIAVQFRRIYYDYNGPTTGGLSDNFAAFFVEGNSDNKIYDCYITGNYSSDGSGNSNLACITFYDHANFTVRNNTFYNFHNGIHVKVGTNSGEISYNRFEQASYGCMRVYSIEPNNSLTIHHNLGIGAGGIEDRAGTANAHTYSAYHNTFVGGPAVGSGATQVSMLYMDDNTVTTGTYEFYNNLIVINASRTTYMRFSEISFESFFSDFTKLDHNIYYDSTGAAEYYDGASANVASYISQLSGQPAGADEANSEETTVTFIGSGNYRLANNSQAAQTASDVGGPVGCYVTGNEEIGARINPDYAETLPGNPLFIDTFNYVLSKEWPEAGTLGLEAIQAQGWTVGKFINGTNGISSNPDGYVSTETSIPGYSGTMPGLSGSGRVLRYNPLPTTEAFPRSGIYQSEVFLQYGTWPDADLPADCWYQFWIYINNYGSEQSHFAAGNKWFYPAPTNDEWTVSSSNMPYLVNLSKSNFETDGINDENIRDANNAEMYFTIQPQNPSGVYGADFTDAVQYPTNRDKLGPNLDRLGYLSPNQWYLIKWHFDLSGTQGKWEAWRRTLGNQTWVQQASWIGGVTTGFTWATNPDHRTGLSALRFPETFGKPFVEGDYDSWIYVSDFAIATSEADLPVYNAY